MPAHLDFSDHSRKRKISVPDSKPDRCVSARPFVIVLAMESRVFRLLLEELGKRCFNVLERLLKTYVRAFVEPHRIFLGLELGELLAQSSETVAFFGESVLLRFGRHSPVVDEPTSAHRPQEVAFLLLFWVDSVFERLVHNHSYNSRTNFARTFFR